MFKTKKPLQKVLGVVMAFLLLISGSGIIGTGITANALVESVSGTKSLVRTSLAEIKSVLTSVSYDTYISENAGVPDAEAALLLDIFKYFENGTTATVNVGEGEDYGTEGKVLLVGDNGKISFRVNIPSDAFYSIEIEYWTGNAEVKDEDGNTVSKGKSTIIERMVLIDDAVPFKEARSIKLTRSWIDTYYRLDENFKTIYDDKGERLTYTSLDEDYLNAIANQDENTRLFQRDNSGNEMKPVKTLYPIWTTARLHDASGYSAEPLRFALTKGEHVITLNTVREPLAIKRITLVPREEVLSYVEYLEYYKNQGAKDYAGDKAVKVQAEYPTFTSDKTIYQLNDRSSAITEPQHAALQRLNSIGGDKWTYVGQWIEYEITAPEDGFYNIVLRYNQSIMEGMYVSRKILINGELPFEEASNCRFNFDDTWRVAGLHDGKTQLPEGEKSFKFYLKEGVNKIRLEVVLGDMADILSAVENILLTSNAYYRKILMLTGPEPDEYRDYGFEKLMPEVLKGLKQAAADLYDISARLTEVTGIRGANNGTLEKVAIILDRMGRRPNKIAVTLATMKDYLAALGSWLTNTQSQPLELDYILIQSVGHKLPKAESGFWENLWNELKKFVTSFFADYNSISSTTDISAESKKALESASIEVWTTSSREQAQIIKRLIDDDFMHKYNIPVNLKLVVGGTLLPATLAGTGPDVAMNIDQSTPVNYAIRSAVLPLNTTNHGGYDFNDFSLFTDNPVYKDIIDNVDTFDEVFERFAPAAKIPITLYGETYAVPDTMSFSMMFYRKDIFVETNLEVPNTWEQFVDCIAKLQAKNLNVGFPSGLGGTMLLMYQKGEPLYKEGNYDNYLNKYPELFGYDEATGKYTQNVYEATFVDEEGNKVTKVLPKTDGMTINLDSNAALGSFRRVCQYFTMYGLPVSYALADRFRDGTMPLAIADYVSTYNTLIVFAPEIMGLWEFTPLPGTLMEDGRTIDNTTVAAISTMILMRGITDANAFSAWVFMQWWTSAEVQSAYANEMEALLGPSAKQATANIEALSLMSWSKDEIDSLMAQLNAVQCTPEYPGSYIIGRYTNFAFLDVYNKDAEPVAEMLEYIVSINKELSRKRSEFGLVTQEMIREADSKRGGK